MIRPSWLAVLALKALQKSMMLTPWGPSAVPTGGAGVAFPAAIWSLTTACIFFAIPRLQFFDLQEIELDRRRPAEDRDHDLQRVLVEVHVVDQAVEAREGPLVDPDLVALLERVLRLGLFGRLGHLVQDLVDLFTGERRRLG